MNLKTFFRIEEESKTEWEILEAVVRAGGGSGATRLSRLRNLKLRQTDMYLLLPHHILPNTPTLIFPNTTNTLHTTSHHHCLWLARIRSIIVGAGCTHLPLPPPWTGLMDSSTLTPPTQLPRLWNIKRQSLLGMMSILRRRVSRLNPMRRIPDSSLFPSRSMPLHPEGII